MRGLRLLGEEGGERVSLEQVAGVDQEDLVGIAEPERVDNCRGAGQAASKRAVQCVIPGSGVPVDVGGGHDDHPRRVGRNGEAEAGQQDGVEHWPVISVEGGAGGSTGPMRRFEGYVAIM